MFHQHFTERTVSMANYDYDVLYIGSGHAAWHGALILKGAGKKLCLSSNWSSRTNRGAWFRKIFSVYQILLRIQQFLFLSRPCTLQKIPDFLITFIHRKKGRIRHPVSMMVMGGKTIGSLINNSCIKTLSC